MSLTRLPARYDHVGSFLRPQYLLEARAQEAALLAFPGFLPRRFFLERRALGQLVQILFHSSRFALEKLLHCIGELRMLQPVRR
mgnify:CR=1 FL=1